MPFFEVIQFDAQPATCHWMISVAFDGDEFFILDVENHGAGVRAVMRAAPMISLNRAIF